MNPLIRLTGSSLGKKYIVAISGLALVGFIIGHLAGNLTFHAGPNAINTYAEWLHERPAMIWAARVGLLALLVAHVFFTIKLRMENRAARPQRYAHDATMRASRSSRIMIWSGLTVLAFIVFHLLHFTILPKPTDPAFFESLANGEKRHDVYGMIKLGFQNVPVSVFYIIAIGLLCSHLRHGVSSLFQTLGLNSAKVRTLLDKGGIVFATLIFLGYISIPVAALFNR